MRSYYSLLAHCFCTTWLLFGIGACHSPTNSKPNDNLAVQKDTITNEASAIYDIEEYDTIKINGYTLYFEPYDSTGLYVPYNSIVDTLEYSIARNKREQEINRQCANCFKRNNDTLTVVAQNGAHVSFVDNNDEDGDAMAHYEFDGSNNGYYLVIGYFWEWWNVFMINRNTGYVDTLLRTPQFSPDKRNFITTNSDLVAQFQLNAIAYYNIESTAAEPQFTIEIRNWGPSGVKWLSNSEAIIEKETMAVNFDAPPNISYTKMTIMKP